MGPLYQEHLYLGAQFADQSDLPLAAPASYQGEQGDFRRGAGLADLSGMRVRLMHGEPARGFAEAAFAGRKLAVGENRFEASVLGDGSVSSIALLARTGDREYLALDASPRGELLCAWLDFLQHVEQGGFAPYAGLQSEDVSGSLVPLLIWGTEATQVLGDYVAQVRDLPAQSQVRNCALDKIQCLAMRLPVPGPACYLVMAPPQRAVALWRSLLSFEVVEPVGTRRLVQTAEDALPWVGGLLRPAAESPSNATLLEWGVVRAESDFVGARALRS